VRTGPAGTTDAAGTPDAAGIRDPACGGRVAGREQGSGDGRVSGGRRRICLGGALASGSVALVVLGVPVLRRYRGE
jgi:hypothetical protein